MPLTFRSLSSSQRQVPSSVTRTLFPLDHRPTRREALFTFGVSSFVIPSGARGYERKELCPPTLEYNCSSGKEIGFTLLSTEEYVVELPSDYLTLPKDASSEILQAQRFQSEDGLESASLIRRLASSVKPTFFQVSDISNYGDPETVGKLILPKNLTNLSSSVRVVHQDSVDTGTIRGTISIPDINIYKYQYRSPGGSIVCISAAAIRGNVYLLATSASEKDFKDLEPKFNTIHNSFTLFRKVEL